MITREWLLCGKCDNALLIFLKAAKNFLVQLKTHPNNVGKIPDELRPLLGVPEDFQEEELRGKPLKLISEVKKACKMLENDLTVAHDQRGGRAPDSRIRHFARTLAIIYERYIGEPPTFTIDKDDHGLSSPFALFGEEAFAQFCPSELNAPGKVRLALQEAAQESRELEEFHPNKVK